MDALRLVIGNKNYSSWSLRAWLAVKRTGLPFEEVVVPLDRPETEWTIRRYTASGKVPVLLDGDLTVWDSLAIAEYLAERVPDAGLWPANPQARAVARAVTAEMHSGFAALRRTMPMDVRTHAPKAPDHATRRDIDRVLAIWHDCRTRFGGDGPYLFGPFTVADAFYAPVVSRFVTYGVELPGDAWSYVHAIMAHPAMQQWKADAQAEPWVIADP